MAISLTSSGLYLEPRAYTNGSGANYGTPKFVSSATSLGGGSWTGLYFYESSGSSGWPYYSVNVDSNVASSHGEGGYISESLDNSRKGGGLNANDKCWNRTLLFLCNWKYNCKSSERGSLLHLCEIFRKFIYSSIKWKCICPRLQLRSNRRNNLFNNNWNGRQKVLLNKISLNLNLVKEVA